MSNLTINEVLPILKRAFTNKKLKFQDPIKHNDKDYSIKNQIKFGENLYFLDQLIIFVQYQSSLKEYYQRCAELNMQAIHIHDRKKLIEMVEKTFGTEVIKFDPELRHKKNLFSEKVFDIDKFDIDNLDFKPVKILLMSDILQTNNIVEFMKSGKIKRSKEEVDDVKWNNFVFTDNFDVECDVAVVDKNWQLKKVLEMSNRPIIFYLTGLTNENIPTEVIDINYRKDNNRFVIAKKEYDKFVNVLKDQ